jgi:hypothetical protein
MNEPNINPVNENDDTEYYMCMESDIVNTREEWEDTYMSRFYVECMRLNEAETKYYNKYQMDSMFEYVDYIFNIDRLKDISDYAFLSIVGSY